MISRFWTFCIPSRADCLNLAPILSRTHNSLTQIRFSCCASISAGKIPMTPRSPAPENSGEGRKNGMRRRLSITIAYVTNK